MSNLDSKFDIQRGWPAESQARELDLPAATGVTLTEGMIVKVENDGSGNPVFNKLTSSLVQALGGSQDGAVLDPDVPYVVIRGTDQADVSASGKVTALRLNCGLVVKTERYTPDASLVPGSKIISAAGVATLQAFTVAQIGATGVYRHAGYQVIGEVLSYDSTNGYLIFAS